MSKYKINDDVTIKGREKGQITKVYDENKKETYYMVKTEKGELKAVREEELKEPVRVSLKDNVEEVKKEEKQKAEVQVVKKEEEQKRVPAAAAAAPKEPKKEEEKVKKTVTVSNEYYSETKTVEGIKKGGQVVDDKGKLLTRESMRRDVIKHAPVKGKAFTPTQFDNKVASQTDLGLYNQAKAAGLNVTPIKPHVEDKDNDGKPDILEEPIKDVNGDGINDKYQDKNNDGVVDSLEELDDLSNEDENFNGIPDIEEHPYNSIGYDDYDDVDLDFDDDIRNV